MGEKRYDVAVIGSGPGGYVAAIRAAQLGLETACIEKESSLGGTCLNVGCIPSKALLQSTEYYDTIRQKGGEHGITFDALNCSLDKMMQRKEAIVKGLTQGISLLFTKNRIDRIEGLATFRDPHTVEVGGKKISADNFILATGSEPVELPFLPFDEERVVSSTGALSLKRVPKKMAVIGAGVIGLELASVYRRLGSEITVIEMLDSVTPMMDAAISKLLKQTFEKQGFEFFLSSKLTSGSLSDKGVEIHFENEKGKVKREVDTLLVSVGRRPYTKGLAPEKAGLALDRGFVDVDDNFRSSVPHIYAIGDLIRGPGLAHRASEEGMAAAEIIAGKKAHVNLMAIPNVIYTSPEVASLGLTEKEALEMGLELMIGTFPFKGNPRARCSGETEGIVKVIGDKKSGRLIGLHIIGPHASELIAEGVMAIEKKMAVEELARASHAHPTFAEAIKDAALAALKRPIHG